MISLKFKNMKEFEIQNLKVGEFHPPIVIAEIGINHSGSIKLAKEMVDAAKRAGRIKLH